MGFKMPKWQRELNDYCGIKKLFIIEGNISDLYIYPAEGGSGDGETEYVPLSLDELLKRVFSDRSSGRDYDLLFCNPLMGFEPNPNGVARPEDYVKKYNGYLREESENIRRINGSVSSGGQQDKAVFFSEIIRTALTSSGRRETEGRQENESGKPVAVVYNYASRILTSAESISPPDNELFLNLFYGVQHASGVGKNANTLVMIVNKFNDLPAWFYYENPFAKLITIPDADRDQRQMFIDMYYPELSDDPELKEVGEKFVDGTHGMFLRDITDIWRLGKNMNFGASQIPEVLSIYKYGFKDSPWTMYRERLGNSKEEIVEKLKSRVLGQDGALEAAAEILMRSVVGLSGIQHSKDNTKPRGIMFMAGPTGTGKTELVKTVAELLFGDERSLLRFDMSEYREDNSDQKLFGAPPGYVGYNNGGQLTNAVRNNPFSVLLFDEIDKASKSIMDKFLQILEDGRLTDGQGNTVYFGETLIFFTSNAGMNWDFDDDVDASDNGALRRKVIEKLDSNFFRPEVKNRIGDNIVVFRKIDPESARKICRMKIGKIADNVRKRYKVDIECSEEALGLLLALSEKRAAEQGGRGIVNILETNYLNPLSECMFNLHVKENERLTARVKNSAIVFERSL